MKLFDYIISTWINIYPTKARKAGNHHCRKGFIKIYEPAYREEVIIIIITLMLDAVVIQGYPASDMYKMQVKYMTLKIIS